MKKALFISISALFILTGCKKNYDCTCSDPSGTLVVVTFKDNKGRAKEKCTAYYDQHYGSVPFNQVTCEIK